MVWEPEQVDRRPTLHLVARFSVNFLSDPRQINFFVAYLPWKYMQFLYVVLIKETTPSFQSIFFCYTVL